MWSLHRGTGCRGKRDALRVSCSTLPSGTAEYESRRKRELLVMNSTGQTLDRMLDLSDSCIARCVQMGRTLQHGPTSLYLFDQKGTQLRRIARLAIVRNLRALSARLGESRS